MTDRAQKSDLVDILMKVHVTTERAVLASDDGDKAKAVWLPLSQIELAPKDDYHEITMPEWLAAKHGLI